MDEQLRRPALHAFLNYIVDQDRPGLHLIKHWWTRTPGFCQKLNRNSIFTTRSPISKPSVITLRKYTVLKHWWVVYAFSLLSWSTPCFTTRLGCTQQIHNTELYLNLRRCGFKPSTITLRSFSHFHYIAELHPILIHCLGIPKFITLLRQTVTRYVAEPYPFLTQSWGIANIKTLLSYNLS